MSEYKTEIDLHLFQNIVETNTRKEILMQASNWPHKI